MFLEHMCKEIRSSPGFMTISSPLRAFLTLDAHFCPLMGHPPRTDDQSQIVIEMLRPEDIEYRANTWIDSQLSAVVGHGLSLMLSFFFSVSIVNVADLPFTNPMSTFDLVQKPKVRSGVD
mmetsp:Transcript_6209/g.23432  ORF Transcript_6209/g.23432 Transcript_6209/m.23432 type:complete len:120 (+) Transcript_6209:17-376(+)